MVEVDVLKQLIAENDAASIKTYMIQNDLVLRDGKIYPKNPEVINTEIVNNARRQLIKKCQNNSLYGCLLNEYSRFYDKRFGQSVTLCGRTICKHLNSYVNECITGEYVIDGAAILAADTDSISGDSVIDTTSGQITIEELYDLSSYFAQKSNKEYGFNNLVKVATYNPDINEKYYENIDYVYRHKVTKEKWEVEDENGNVIILTNDHSIMIERNGIFMECKPAELLDTDMLISIMVEKVKIKSIKKLENFNDEYVYDIGIKSPINKHNWFFANNMLVHNSSQFSAWSTLKPMVESGKLEWNRDTCVELYTAIGDKVNESFVPFMEKAFNCPPHFGEHLKASCESVGEHALYITKKRYAILNYYLDGKRIDDKPKLKAMGLDLRRSDTPVICQQFLKEILLHLLNGGTEDEIIDKILTFKAKFKALPLHEQGTPRRINKLTYYGKMIDAGKGNRAPGHVRAAINWNNLRDINNDNVHSKIVDGMKCCVLPLKANILNMTSIALPIDEPHVPDWFRELPFDGDATVAALVDKKVENLYGKLPFWKKMKSATQRRTTFEDFFE